MILVWGWGGRFKRVQTYNELNHTNIIMGYPMLIKAEGTLLFKFGYFCRLS